MNAYANADLKMPAHYVDMSEKEMEYDGTGWFKNICNSVGNWASNHKKEIALAAGIGLCVVGLGVGFAAAGSLALLGTAIASSIPITGYCCASVGICLSAGTATTLAGGALSVASFFW